MFAVAATDLELSDAWLEGDESARWRSAAAHGPGTGADASGSSILEVDPGCRLPRHTDSGEELIVLLAGRAEIAVGEESAAVVAPAVALVPKDVSHEVRNAGDDVLRFAAVYAEPDVTTTYGAEVQPDGGRERKPVA